MLIEKMYEWKIALLPGLHSQILTGSVEYWLNLMLNSFWEFPIKKYEFIKSLNIFS